MLKKLWTYQVPILSLGRHHNYQTKQIHLYCPLSNHSESHMGECDWVSLSGMLFKYSVIHSHLTEGRPSCNMK